MNLTARCLKCGGLLEETDEFGILQDERNDFFDTFGQPLRCTACSMHFAAEDGVTEYEITEHFEPIREFGYLRWRDKLLFVANLWPGPDTMGTVFRLEDLAEKENGTCLPFEDIEASLPECDLELLGPVFNALMVCRSVGSIGQVWVHANVPIDGTILLALDKPRLRHHEVWRRVSAFYEPGSVISARDRRFYMLIRKVMARIRQREYGKGIDAFAKMNDFGFMESAMTWAEENYGKKFRPTPIKVRVLRAVIEHFALESMRGIAASEATA